MLELSGIGRLWGWLAEMFLVASFGDTRRSRDM